MDDILDFPDQPAPVKRPLAVTIVCVINWAVALLAFTSAGVSYKRLIVNTNFMISTSYMVVCVVACVGIWQMKRWAAVTYMVSSVLILVIMLLAKNWLWPIVIPIASVLVIERYFKTHKALLPN